MIKKISLIGAGNLATRLGLALHSAGLDITQVYSRTIESAKALAEQLDAQYTNEANQINTSSDLLIVAIKDDAITDLLKQLDMSNTFVVHTSGSVPMDSLKPFGVNYGVFYPLQTFSKNRVVDFSEIPFCIEASRDEGVTQLKELAGKLSTQIYEICSEERKALHLSAVFTCNFVNHFYQIGSSMLADSELSFDLLKPLIKETASKVMDLNPIDAQTGPAVRFDETIINKHIQMLEAKPELQKIYSFVSESIHQTHKRK